MNANRRKKLAALRERLNVAENKLGEAHAEAEDIRDEISGVMEEEQEAFNNLPESLQNGEKGGGMSEAISEMENAIEGLTEFCDGGDADFDEWRSNLEQAEAY